MVTGAGGGIGRASAIALSQAGFTVALVGRKAEPLEELAHDIGIAGGKAMALPGSVADEAQVAAIFARVKQELGRLDFLFNNAGQSAPKTLLENVEIRHWRRVLDVNVTGAFLCTQEAFKMMKSQDPRGGRIINNGSVSAQVPRPLGIAYTTSKHAVTGLTKATALDGREFDIACGQIDIGNAATEAGAAGLERGMQQPDGRIVPEAVMNLQSVADAVTFMASQPLDANILFMTVLATKMPFIGRG
jgi:NAD(P)-dependent dehydrogenase (short-subunit alcohol dehydrogenase family)